MQLTPKLNLKKPDLTDSINVQDLNDNMDVLDTAVSELQEGSASIPDLETNDKTLAGAINEIKQTVSDVGTNAKEYTDQQTAAIDTKINKHINDDSGHVRFIGNASGGDGMACRTDLAPVDLVNGKLVPKRGYAFRIFKVDGPNTGPATLALVADTAPGNPSSIAYPILDSRGQTLKGGEMAKNGIYTLSFNGTNFILQGEGREEKKGMRVKSIQLLTCAMSGMEMVKDFNINPVISGSTAIKATFRTNSTITGVGTAQAYLSGSNIIRLQRGQQLDNNNNVILEIEVIEYEPEIKVINSTAVIYNGAQSSYQNIPQFSTANTLIFHQFYSTNNVGLQALVSVKKSGGIVNGKQSQLVFATGEPISSGAVYISYWLVEYPTA